MQTLSTVWRILWSYCFWRYNFYDLHSSGKLGSPDLSSFTVSVWDILSDSSLRTKLSKINARFPCTAWPFKMWQIGCPERSVFNSLPALRNIPEVRRPNLYSGGSLKSVKSQMFLLIYLFSKVATCEHRRTTSFWNESYIIAIKEPKMPFGIHR